MSLQLQLSAELVAAPSSAGDSTFPNGTADFTFGLLPAQKGYTVGVTGSPQVNSPTSFATIAGVGSGGDVTQAMTLYLRVQTPMKVRLTQLDIAGGADIVSIVEVSGVLLVEFPSNGYLKLLEVQGSGPMEWGAWGLQ